MLVPGHSEARKWLSRWKEKKRQYEPLVGEYKLQYYFEGGMQKRADQRSRAFDIVFYPNGLYHLNNIIDSEKFEYAGTFNYERNILTLNRFRGRAGVRFRCDFSGDRLQMKCLSIGDVVDNLEFMDCILTRR